jgi:type IV pilus assembly protein PilY1
MAGGEGVARPAAAVDAERVALTPLWLRGALQSGPSVLLGSMMLSALVALTTLLTALLLCIGLYAMLAEPALASVGASSLARPASGSADADADADTDRNADAADETAEEACTVTGHSAPRSSMYMGSPDDTAYLFQSDFDFSSWSGRLSRIAVAVAADGTPSIGEQLWEAGALLDAATTARNIQTLTDAQSGGQVPVSFEWGQLTAAQQALLDIDPASGTADGLGSQRVGFLRGARGLEQGQADDAPFRRRASILGDSNNSAPLLVGAPAMNGLGPGYQQFYERYRERRRVVYFGANDGMLHEFDAASGQELSAYIPAALIGSLPALSNPAYVHRPYVDGQLAAGEALLNGEWKTVLAAGMGGGARGVFALDVTDPDGSAHGPLWEFTERDDAAIGNIAGPVAIVKLWVSQTAGTPAYRYFALLGNGALDGDAAAGDGNGLAGSGSSAGSAGPANLANSASVDKGGTASKAAAPASASAASSSVQANRSATLFLLALDKQPSARWTLGANYYRLTIAASTSSVANGLGPLAPVRDRDGALLYAYAGDMHGNLWRFDFSARTATASANQPLWRAPVRPVFKASDADDAPQPITQQPKVVFAPGGGYLVLSGTGLSNGLGDAPGGGQQQSYYAVRDVLSEPPQTISGRQALAERTVEVADSNALTVSGAAFSYLGAAAKQGWYIDFPVGEDGPESSVDAGVLAGAKLLFNTATATGEACQGVRAPGAVRGYGLDSLTGLPFDDSGLARSGLVSGYLASPILTGPPIVLQTMSYVGARNATGRAQAIETFTIFNVPGNAGSDADSGGPSNGWAGNTRVLALPLPARRLGWREVANWQELHQAAARAQ